MEGLRNEGLHIDEKFFEKERMKEHKLVNVLLANRANVNAQETQVPETVNG